MPFEVPNSWTWVRLDEICDKIVDGDHNPPKGVETPTQYLMISSRNINHDRIESLENVRYLSKEIFEVENERTRLNVGDILFTSVGSLGRSCVYNGGYNLCFQRSVSIIHTLTSNYWVKYFFDSDYYQNLIIEKATGTAQMGFYLQQLSESYIALPPYNEQLRIVSEIEQWFALINDIETNKFEFREFINQTKSKILDLAIHGKLVPQASDDEPTSELLKRIVPHDKPCDTSHYGNLPKGWCVLTVGQVADYINGRAFKPNEWEKEGLPIIRIQNLNDEDAVYNYSTAKCEDRYLVHKGDLLFAWAASLGTYIWQKDEAWLNQHIFKVIPKPFIDKEFLYFSFINMIDDFYSESHGSGMVHITKGKFEERPIFIPPLMEQKRIVLQLKSIYNIIDSMCSEL